jgi:hypothetical protein
MGSLSRACLAAIALVSWTPASSHAQGSVDTTVYQDYSEPAVRLPMLFGFRLPRYERVDGLSLPWGPRFQLGKERFIADLVVTYRSHLGDFDPSLAARFSPDSQTAITLEAGRYTRTNDRWIAPDLVNSLVSFGYGRDVRNYYRADRAELRVERMLGADTGSVTPYVRARLERAWSTGSRSDTVPGPFSIFGRGAADRLRRPNPEVIRGSIGSAIVGVAGNLELLDLESSGSIEVEIPWSVVGEGHFVQTTLDASLGFATFGSQRFEANLHAVHTSGDVPPPQRFSYLGGPRTLDFVPLLAMGGDRLFFLDTRYRVPIERLTVPVFGAPEIGLRYAVGSAGVHELPDFVQNLGVRLSFALIRLELTVNPADGKTSLSAGLGMVR